MDVVVAGTGDLPDLARLLWMHAAPEERARQPLESFEANLAAWWSHRDGSHVAFLARHPGSDAVGMAWLALVPRVPRPGNNTRLSADIQSVFVVEEQRGAGIAAALVSAASEHATRLGAKRVTVHSGRAAVPLYERLGFASSPQLLDRHL